MNIEKNEAEILSRLNPLRELLKIICRSPQNGVATQIARFNYSPFERIIGAFDGNLDKASDFRKWRFLTYHKQFRANYFEVWHLSDERNRTFYLEKIYLHLYYFNPIKSIEFAVLSLHSDPNEPLEEAHCLYKRSPHLHLSYPKSPFGEAHIALNKYDLDYVLQNIENLETAFFTALTMIKEEIILKDNTYEF